MNLSVLTDFPLLCAEYNFMHFFASHDFINLLWNALPLFTQILFGLWLDPFNCNCNTYGIF